MDLLSRVWLLQVLKLSCEFITYGYGSYGSQSHLMVSFLEDKALMTSNPSYESINYGVALEASRAG